MESDEQPSVETELKRSKRSSTQASTRATDLLSDWGPFEQERKESYFTVKRRKVNDGSVQGDEEAEVEDVDNDQCERNPSCTRGFRRWPGAPTASGPSASTP